MDKKIFELISYSDNGILSKVLLKNDKVDNTLFCMAKGTQLSEHTSTKQAIIYVLEGKGMFNLEGKKIKMTEGTFIHMKENAVHSLKVSENTSFILISINN